jgi:hypothetical protein
MPPFLGPRADQRLNVLNQSNLKFLVDGNNYSYSYHHQRAFFETAIPPTATLVSIYSYQVYGHLRWSKSPCEGRMPVTEMMFSYRQRLRWNNHS